MDIFLSSISKSHHNSMWCRRLSHVLLFVTFTGPILGDLLRLKMCFSTSMRSRTGNVPSSLTLLLVLCHFVKPLKNSNLQTNANLTLGQRMIFWFGQTNPDSQPFSLPVSLKPWNLPDSCKYPLTPKTWTGSSLRSSRYAHRGFSYTILWYRPYYRPYYIDHMNTEYAACNMQHTTYPNLNLSILTSNIPCNISYVTYSFNIFLLFNSLLFQLEVFYLQVFLKVLTCIFLKSEWSKRERKALRNILGYVGKPT